MDHKSFRASRAVSVAAGLALTGLLVACGSDPVTRPPDPPTAAPPPPPSIVSTGQGTLEVDFIGRAAPFTTTATGNLEATVDWTFASDDVDVFLARGDCTPEQFIDTQCNIAAFSTSETAKPEKVRLTAAPPGVYTLLVGNAGPERESLSWQVVLTPTVASTAPAVSAATTSARGLGLPGKARIYRGRASW